MAQALSQLPSDTETASLRSLLPQLDRALDLNQAVANAMRAAHTQLGRLAACLHDPADERAKPPSPLPGQALGQAIDSLLAEFRPDPRHQAAQAALQSGWQRVCKAWADDLLSWYERAGLAADTLQMVSFFNRIRQHERRISGRASTRPVGGLGAYQVLFIAEREQDLLAQLRRVCLADDLAQRQRLVQCEAGRQQRYRFHHDPAQAIQAVLEQHATRRTTLMASQCPRNALM